MLSVVAFYENLCSRLVFMNKSSMCHMGRSRFPSFIFLYAKLTNASQVPPKLFCLTFPKCFKAKSFWMSTLNEFSLFHKSCSFWRMNFREGSSDGEEWAMIVSSTQNTNQIYFLQKSNKIVRGEAAKTGSKMPGKVSSQLIGNSSFWRGGEGGRSWLLSYAERR